MSLSKTDFWRNIKIFSTPDEKSHGPPRYTTRIMQKSRGRILLRFWVKEPRHPENTSDENCPCLYRSTRVTTLASLQYRDGACRVFTHHVGGAFLVLLSLQWFGVTRASDPPPPPVSSAVSTSGSVLTMRCASTK